MSLHRTTNLANKAAQAYSAIWEPRLPRNPAPDGVGWSGGIAEPCDEQTLFTLPRGDPLLATGLGFTVALGFLLCLTGMAGRGKRELKTQKATKINSKWIPDINVKCETIKLRSDNIGENPHDFGYGDT